MCTEAWLGNLRVIRLRHPYGVSAQVLFIVIVEGVASPQEYRANLSRDYVLIEGKFYILIGSFRSHF